MTAMAEVAGLLTKIGDLQRDLRELIEIAKAFDPLTAEEKALIDRIENTLPRRLHRG